MTHSTDPAERLSHDIDVLNGCRGQPHKMQRLLAMGEWCEEHQSYYWVCHCAFPDPDADEVDLECPIHGCGIEYAWTLTDGYPPDYLYSEGCCIVGDPEDLDDPIFIGGPDTAFYPRGTEGLRPTDFPDDAIPTPHGLIYLPDTAWLPPRYEQGERTDDAQDDQ